MKIKFKNNTLEAEVVLPEKPSEVAEKIFSNEPIALADGGFVDSPEFDGMAPEEETESTPVTHPEIRVTEVLNGIEDMPEILQMFYDESNYETLEIEDEETQETRTFVNVELGAIQYIPLTFNWNEDGHGGLADPTKYYYAEICLRGDEVE